MNLKLRTEISIEPCHGLLTHERPVVLLGSCFSDSIGRRLAERGFTVAANPLGPVYNPVAMKLQAELIASGRLVTPSDLFEHLGLWRFTLAHTLLARPSAEAAAEAINEALAGVRSLLAQSPLLCLTLGSAHAYDLEPEGITVANCHKLPASRFTRRLIGLDEATTALTETLSTLPHSHAVITVSPIRYLADGLAGNSLSKATLRLAADAAAADGRAIYFPAYEAVTDDLRDYRFYNPDMTHPTEQAADYVYALFEEAYATPATRAASAEALKASRRAAHRQLIQ